MVDVGARCTVRYITHSIQAIAEYTLFNNITVLFSQIVIPPSTRGNNKGQELQKEHGWHFDTDFINLQHPDGRCDIQYPASKPFIKI